jgi:heme/copper-type cytochrome/quinol oxidase subunit 2
MEKLEVEAKRAVLMVLVVLVVLVVMVVVMVMVVLMVLVSRKRQRGRASNGLV